MKLLCSDCGKEILGSVAIVADAGVEDEGGMEWGDIQLYPSSTGKGFALLHPNCFKRFQDEVLRQERGVVLSVGLMTVEDAREALEIE
jgi:hypothetical protein